MKRYIFSGRVIPERASVFVSQHTLTNKDIEISVRIKATIEIKNSVIFVDFEVEDKKYDVIDYKNIVKSLCRTSLDTYGYFKGYGYELEITSARDFQSGENTVFGVDVVEITKAEKERSLTFNRVLLLGYKHFELKMALNDLGEAVRKENDTAFYCKRSVENTRQYFKDKNKKNDTGWEKMQKTLNVYPKYTQELTEKAQAQRHADFTSMTGNERIKLMKVAWQVVDRFIIYLDSKKELDEKEYPRLES